MINIVHQAFLSLVQSLEWKDFTVLYEDNEGLVRLQVQIFGDDNDDHICFDGITGVPTSIFVLIILIGSENFGFDKLHL